MQNKSFILFLLTAFLAFGLLTIPLTTATRYDITFPSTQGTTQTLPPGTWIVQSTQDSNLVYNQNEGFKVQDIADNILNTFTVTSGSLLGTGNLNATTSGGVFQITPTSSGTLTATSTSPIFYVISNGQPLTNGVLNYASGNTYSILWQYTIPPGPPPIIVGTTNSILYFRSDQYSNNNMTANGLDPTNTNTPASINDTITTQTVTYGFRVWTIHRYGATTELTTGIPTAQVTRSTDGAGWQNATWLCPNTALNIGIDALKVGIYLSLDGGDTWTQRATYITHPLLNAALLQQTWTFNLYTTRTTNTATSFTFGSLIYHSSINNIGLQPPTDTQLQTWRFLNGDWIGFILGTYTSQIGAAAYLLILLIPTTTLYLRHRNFGPVLIMFALFGGPGGIVWLFVPGFAAAAVDILLVLGASFIVWKLIR
jgi:hypothetical protein